MIYKKVNIKNFKFISIHEIEMSEINSVSINILNTK